MATQSRVYIITPRVTEEGKQQRRLVRATHPGHALRHVAADQFLVTVAGQDDLIECLDAGIKVEKIKHEQHELA